MMSTQAGQYELLLGSPQLSKATPQRPANDRLHRHTFFEPCLVVDGRGELVHGDRRIPLRQGDLFVSDTGVAHAIRSRPSHSLTLYYTSFAILQTDRRPANRAEFVDWGIWRFLKQHRLVRHGQDHLAAAFGYVLKLSQLSDRSQRDGYLSEWMKLLVMQMIGTLATGPAAGSRHRRRQDDLADALEAIDARLNRSIRIREVARAVSMSERSLQRLFRRRLGSTVVQQIQQRRMQRAASLLMGPELSVSEVGRRVGIEDAGQFSRLFKKQIGLTPRQFRSTRSPAAHGWIQTGAAPMKTVFVD